MDFSIAALLAQDGLTNGAIYCLLALALVLVFAVTRVIFVQQGEFVAFTVLTLAAFEQNKLPGTVWLLLALGVTAAVAEVLTYRSDVRRMLRAMAGSALPSMVAAALVWGVHAMQAGFLLQVLATVLAVTAMGPAGDLAVIGIATALKAPIQLPGFVNRFGLDPALMFGTFVQSMPNGVARIPLFLPATTAGVYPLQSLALGAPGFPNVFGNTEALELH